MPRERMSSFGETTAALEGQRGHILVANHHEEGLLPRTAATAGHPLLDPRHQRPSGFGLASLRPRASRWLRVQAFPTTHSRISTRSLHHLLPHPLLASPTPSPASFITDSLNSTPTKPLLPAASSVSASAPLQPDCPLRYRPYLSDPHCDFPDMVKWRPQRVAPRHWVSIGRFSRNGHHVLQQQHPALTTTTTSSSSTTSSTNCQDGGCNLFAVTLSTS